MREKMTTTYELYQDAKEAVGGQQGEDNTNFCT